MKHAGAVLVAFSLLLGLAACGRPEEPIAQGTGRFVELDITPPRIGKYVSDVVADGEKLYVLSNSPEQREGEYVTLYRLHGSPDGGKSWQEYDLDWLEDIRAGIEAEKADDPDRWAYLGGIRLAWDGKILFNFTINSSTPEPDRWYIGAADGSYELLTLAIQEELAGGEEAQLGVSIPQPLPGGRLLARVYAQKWNADMGVYEYDSSIPEVFGIFSTKTGELLTELPAWYDYTCGSENIALLDFEHNWTVYSIEKGQPIENQPAMLESAAYNMKLDAQGRLVYQNADGICRLGAEGEPEPRLAAGHFSFGSPLYSLMQLCVLEPEGYVMALRTQQDSCVLKKIVFDPQAEQGQAQTLRVFSLKEHDTVRQAIYLLGIRHPELTVEYEYYYSRSGSPIDDTMGEDDLLRALNLRVLNGEGPDVLILDGLPWQSYVNQQTLEDISDLVAGENDSLFAQIIGPMYTGQALYTLPTRFAVPLLFTRRSEQEQYASLDALLAAIAQSEVSPLRWNMDGLSEEEVQVIYKKNAREWELGERPVIQFGNPNDVLDALLMVSMPAIFTGEEIDRDALTTLLATANAIVEYNCLTDPGIAMETAASEYDSGSADFYSLDAFLSRRAQAGYARLASASYIRDAVALTNLEEPPPDPVTKENITVQLMPGLVTGAYQPLVMAGVSAASGNKELARELVACLLDSENQDYDFYEGMPVYSRSFADLIEYAQQSVAQYAQIPPSNVEYDFSSLFASLETPVHMDRFLVGLVKQYAQPYFEGTQTLEQAVEALLEAAHLYYAEKQ